MTRVDAWFYAAFGHRLAFRHSTFKDALRLVARAGWADPVLAEVGSFRSWAQGGSTGVFARFCRHHGGRVVSVDRRVEPARLAARALPPEDMARVTFLVGDAVAELGAVGGPVALLYLDGAGPEDPTTVGDSYQRDQAAQWTGLRDLLVPGRSVVLLDDDRGGTPRSKARLTRPLLGAAGWRCVVDEYQSVWVHETQEVAW